MMAGRSAADRAAFALAVVADGDVVVDVGCGPGSITGGLAEAVAPTGRVLGLDARQSQVEAGAAAARRAGRWNARFAVADAYGLPVADHVVDVYFSHALFEHLDAPDLALREARRVLRPGGTLALAASDWSRARFDPRTADVARAMEAHHRLRRSAGGDPEAGGRLAELAERAGFTGVVQTSHHRVDLSYRELARYVGSRLDTALRADGADDELRQAAEAARRWAATDGTAEQCWTEVVARAPYRSRTA
jgi:ubiquinone/menaquinone biosynthesis C-methylase UbiE